MSKLRILSVSGALTVVLYIAYFFLMQTHSLWQSPTLVPDKWKSVFHPIAQLFPNAWVRAPKFSDLALVSSGLYMLLIAAMFAVFFVALRAATRPGTFTTTGGARPLRIIFVVALFASVILFVVPGVLSTDLFSYVWYGRILVGFGDNPFTHVPMNYFWRDEGNWLQWVFWKNTPSVYGPVWVLIAGAVAEVAKALGGDIVYHVLGHKVVATLSYLANIALMWNVSGLVFGRYFLPSGGAEAVEDRRTRMQVLATLAYAWNPLIVLEFAANGHNDVLMLTGVLAALWLHLKGRWRWAVAALAITALVKAIVLVFLPGYLWLLFWQAAPGGLRNGFPSRLGRIAQASAITAATWVVFYLPFWEGPATLKPLIAGPPVEYYVNSLGYVLRFKLPPALSDLASMMGWQPRSFWTSSAVGMRLNWPAHWGPMLITAAVALTQTWKARTFPSMLVAWGWVLFAYLTVGAVWFWPWYVSWLVIIAALAGPGRLFTATQILSATSMTIYGMYWVGSPVFTDVAGYKGIVLMVPPLAYVLISWRRERSKVPELTGEPVPKRKEPVRKPAVRVATSPQFAAASEDASAGRPADKGEVGVPVIQPMIEVQET